MTDALAIDVSLTLRWSVVRLAAEPLGDDERELAQRLAQPV